MLVRPSVPPGCNYLCIDGLLYNLTITNVVLIETMCSDLDPGPYLKGHGHMRVLKDRSRKVSGLLLTYELKFRRGYSCPFDCLV